MSMLFFTQLFFVVVSTFLPKTHFHVPIPVQPNWRQIFIGISNKIRIIPIIQSPCAKCKCLWPRTFHWHCAQTFALKTCPTLGALQLHVGQHEGNGHLILGMFSAFGCSRINWTILLANSVKEQLPSRMRGEQRFVFFYISGVNLDIFKQLFPSESSERSFCE